MNEFQTEEFFLLQGKTGGQRCKCCNKWIKTPRKRKYDTPIWWTKCIECDKENVKEIREPKMIWNDVEVNLPKSKERFIAKCQNNNQDGCGWGGIVDVYFDPHIGWVRCESTDKSPLYVTHYAPHPYIDEKTITEKN